METINPNSEASSKRNLPRDMFLHLFAIVALYWSAISFITLCWQYINHFFPDPLLYRYGVPSSAGAIRFAVASLMIIFPLFLLASWQLNKIYRRESGVRESRIRKWLLYFTLFATSLIVMGDLVTVIYNFLGGDITVRFILKALSVLIVAAVIFWYYLNDVRLPQPPQYAKYFASVSAVMALVLVVGAFFIVGSPKSARLAQLDNQRVGDLQSIQWQIVNYWQRKGTMPQQLSDLTDSISGYSVPVDPALKQPYQYVLTDPPGLGFQLCANFSTDTTNQAVSGPLSMPKYPPGNLENWTHRAGIHCFERTIDQQLYPPINK